MSTRTKFSQLRVLAALFLATNSEAAFNFFGPRKCLAPRASHLQSNTAILPTVTELEDNRLWLEEATNPEAVAWVHSQAVHVVNSIGEPGVTQEYMRLVEAFDSQNSLPHIDYVLNGLCYNFDLYNNIWRRCSLDEYRKPQPIWETVLDLNVFNRGQKDRWMWCDLLDELDEGPDVRRDRVIIHLSRSGADATVAREFDLDKKEFVPPEEGGFVLPEARVSVRYKDRNTLFVGGVFGDQDMTNSGMPRSVYEWQRGTPLSSAKKVYECEQSDTEVEAWIYWSQGERYEMRKRSITPYANQVEIKQLHGSFARIPAPDVASKIPFGDQLLIGLAFPWLGCAGGSVVAAPLQAFIKADSDEARKAMLKVLFAPTDTCTSVDMSATLNYLILRVLNDVVTELRFWRYDGGSWTLEQSTREKDLLSCTVQAFDPHQSDAFWIKSQGYTQPVSLSLAEATAPAVQEKLKSSPSSFDARSLTTQQHFATSKDGTRVPYFLVSNKSLPMDGSTLTLLHGYGGYGKALTPEYVDVVGVAWLEKGYAYAVANIRGGGEYGPWWHQAGIIQDRNKGYEDFEAVARDLIARGITSPKRLACKGVSNGGLLTGNMFVRSPDLFGAVVCQAPLLDMYRYTKMPFGHYWIDEYGNPEEDWDWLQKYSPYHNLELDKKYPPILFTATTNDDRVSPAHTRKMVRKLLDMGNTSVYYYENMEGGHRYQGGTLTEMLAYMFLEQVLSSGTVKNAQASSLQQRWWSNPGKAEQSRGALKGGKGKSKKLNKKSNKIGKGGFGGNTGSKQSKGKSLAGGTGKGFG